MPVGPSSGRGRKSVDYSQKWGFMRGFMGHAIVISEWYTDFGLPAFLKLQNLERKVIINEIDKTKSRKLSEIFLSLSQTYLLST